MTVTQSDIDALKAAINSGARAVTYSDGSEVQYRSLEEMRSILRDMQSELAATKPVRAFRGVVRGGY